MLNSQGAPSKQEKEEETRDLTTNLISISFQPD
jgi:hypothetical protein